MKNLFTISILFFSTLSFATDCPIPRTSITPSVKSSVNFNTKTKLYTYNYTVTNNKQSLLSLDAIALMLSAAPPLANNPKDWNSSYIDHLGDFRWDTANINEDSNPLPGDTFVVPIEAIKPGQTLSGFSIQSPLAPGAVEFFAWGFDQPIFVAPIVDAAHPENNDDEPVPDCPGYDPTKGAVFEKLVNAITIGPIAANTVSPKIRLRNESGEHKHGSIDPEQPNGKVSLLVLSSADFDASQIDVSTIKFGAKKVAPLASKLVPGKEHEDENDNEEWEKISDGLKKEAHKKHNFKNLLLTFDLESLKIRCVLDNALFLTAKTKTGLNVSSGVSIQTTGCDIHNPGVRSKPLKRDLKKVEIKKDKDAKKEVK